LPASGTMRNGVVWDRATLALPTSESGGSALRGAAGTWPTPTARDGKDGACCFADVPTNGLLGRAAPRSAYMRGDLVTHAGRIHPPQRIRLNPRFAEWLMGWPLGWTEIEPLGMESIRWPLLWRLRFLEAVGGCGRYEPSEDL
jgi:hypothetical protein